MDFKTREPTAAVRDSAEREAAEVALSATPARPAAVS